MHFGRSFVKFDARVERHPGKFRINPSQSIANFRNVIFSLFGKKLRICFKNLIEFDQKLDGTQAQRIVIFFGTRPNCRAVQILKRCIKHIGTCAWSLLPSLSISASPPFPPSIVPLSVVPGVCRSLDSDGTICNDYVSKINSPAHRK